MMPKRTAAASADSSGRDKKRAKFIDSRKIKVQDSALKDGRRLDVPKFLQTREFEIKQLEKTMLNSKKAGSKRAFQKVPRELRRRTASHNPKRVPPRLRNRAIMEMDPAADAKPKRLGRGHGRAKHLAIEKSRSRHTKAEMARLGQSKEQYQRYMHKSDCMTVNEKARSAYLGKKDQHQQNQRFEKRQKDKIWLPTHVWHAKRAHLTNQWGYSIPQRPTAKSYRPTHRASSQVGAVAWDASYMCSIIVDRKEALVKIGAQDATLKKYTSGRKVWEGILQVDDGKGNKNPIGPGMVYWRSDGDMALVQVHPAMFDTVFDSIADFNGTQAMDCRYAIGSIDITGPKALAALRSVLKPTEHSEVWNTLSSTSNTSSLPSSMALPLDVYDPRYYSAKDFKVKKQDTETIADAILSLNEPPASSKLFSSQHRQLSYDTQASLKELHSRSEPGKDVSKPSNDNPIPTLLLKRKDNSWSLFLPWHWVLHFWHQLMQVPNIRLGGLDQRRQLAFENGQLFFPNDYPFTPAGREYYRLVSEQERSQWLARQPGKRTNFEKIGEHSPFECQWENLPRDKLVAVKITMHDRGHPSDHARIYRDAAQGAASAEEGEVIGYVTHGGFNLNTGKGHAIGLLVKDKTVGSTVHVRNVGTVVFRRAGFELL